MKKFKELFFLFIILVFFIFSCIRCIAQGELILNQTSSSGSSTLSTPPPGTLCDIELSKTITNLSYPNGCQVDGVNVTCCATSELRMGAISYGDSLGDDVNDLIVSWAVDCTTKQVTFSGSGESVCLARAITLCGEVTNMSGSPQTCTLPSGSSCCQAASPTPSSTPEPEIIKKLLIIIEKEDKAIDRLKADKNDDAVDEISSALSSLKFFRELTFPIDSLIHNATNEIRIRIKNNINCAINHDKKAKKLLISKSPDKNEEGRGFFAQNELKKALNCKEDILEDLEFLAKHQKK